MGGFQENRIFPREYWVYIVKVYEKIDGRSIRAMKGAVLGYCFGDVKYVTVFRGIISNLDILACFTGFDLEFYHAVIWTSAKPKS